MKPNHPILYRDALLREARQLLDERPVLVEPDPLDRLGAERYAEALRECADDMAENATAAIELLHEADLVNVVIEEAAAAIAARFGLPPADGEKSQ